FCVFVFFFQAEDGIRDDLVTGVQTCALPIYKERAATARAPIALMFAVGALAVAALSLLVVGPGFGRWLAGRVGLSAIFVALWPYLRWVLSVSCAVLSIELIYMWAPSSRRPFRSSLPGAVIALASWLTLCTT